MKDTARVLGLRLLSTAAVFAVVAAASPARAGEYGFALTELSYGPWGSESATECPEGFALSAKEVMLRGATTELRQALEAFNKRVGDSSDFVTRVLWERRGPNGTNLCDTPTLVEDPPMPVSRATVSEGFDLDGGDTSKTCAHAEFKGKDGKPGIDNQVRRLTACIKNVNDGRANELVANAFQAGASAPLVRLSGVDSLENDNEVMVEFYKSRDPFAKDGEGKPLPDGTMRAANSLPMFNTAARGKIVDGVLTTEPTAVRFSIGAELHYIRDAVLQVNISPDGFSEGMLGGYFDVASFWDAYTRNPTGQVDYTCPALYKRLHELADGHKDPKTGQCTSLSTAFNIKAVRTFVVPPAVKPES